jgi:trimethylamine--corrinoid protein Co-methyltransferase
MKFARFKVLSDEEIVQIHEASIDILENTGVLVYSKQVLDLLDAKGAVVDYDKRLAKFPRKNAREE